MGSFFCFYHIHRGDYFVIETRNIFRTCESCRREFLMLEEYMSKLGKTVIIRVRTDKSIDGTNDLLKKLNLR